MDVTFSYLWWWLCKGKQQEPRISNRSTINSSTNSVMWQLDGLKFPPVMQANVPSSSKRVPSSSKRVKHEWHSGVEQKIDREYDVVVVSSDGDCVSGSESDDSDWSIGWLEPHGTGFSRDDDETHEIDNSFAVLVPCYGCNYGAIMEKEGTKSNLFSTFGYFPNSYSDGKSFC
ncbi:hypothetical protein VNO78_01272 [Psophocarpus tetragonolobus]|uniref:Uncharacterized protein n=1 Tax=Psophocarpus tetragonolobus TaxID=3891 RepID=A0AAN9T094_PSOTE